MSFKVGDYLTGTKKPVNPYSITNKNAIVKVVSHNPSFEDLNVEVICSKTQPSEKGKCYPVASKFFKKISKEETLIWLI